MMRKIRARAWNHKSQTMYYDILLDSTGNASSMGSFITYNRLKDSVMLQTPFNDKNKVEIWEGDIANSSYGIGKVLWCESTGKFIFEFAHGIEDLWHMCTGVHATKFEVLSNIYQSPNLIDF